MRREQLEKAQVYMRGGVSKLLEKMTYETLKSKPEDVAGFMANWLEANGRPLYADLQKSSRKKPEGVETSDSDNDEEMEEIGELPEAHKPKDRGIRTSVSAEVLVHTSHFAPKVFPKSPSIREELKSMLEKLVLFRDLEGKELDVIIDAFEARKVSAGEQVIKQGDEGHELFVVLSGRLDCSKSHAPGEPEAHLREYSKGDCFGELALMYNTPRQASVLAVENCELYVLDRVTFNRIIMTSAVANREKYENFLKDVKVLKTLGDDEISKLCDCLTLQTFKKGQRVINQGDRGDTFFLVVDGSAGAYQLDPSTGKENRVLDYKEKMYFGELALLKDEPRAASIIADSELKVAKIDRNAFKRILGPLGVILQRNAESYNKPLAK